VRGWTGRRPAPPWAAPCLLASCLSQGASHVPSRCPWPVKQRGAYLGALPAIPELGTCFHTCTRPETASLGQDATQHCGRASWKAPWKPCLPALASARNAFLPSSWDPSSPRTPVEVGPPSHPPPQILQRHRGDRAGRALPETGVVALPPSGDLCPRDLTPDPLGGRGIGQQPHKGGVCFHVLRGHGLPVAPESVRVVAGMDGDGWGAHGHCTRVGNILDGLRPLPALSCDGAGHWPNLPRDAHSWQPPLLTSRQAAVGERWSLKRYLHPAPGNQRVCGWNYMRISNGDHPDGSGSSQPNDRCP
jgi:hypothetical protein